MTGFGMHRRRKFRWLPEFSRKDFQYAIAVPEGERCEPATAMREYLVLWLRWGFSFTHRRGA